MLSTLSSLRRKISRRIRKAVDRRIHGSVLERIETLEYRSFNRRFYAVEQMAEYLLGAQVDGDYAEFGVYKGDTFAHAYRNMHRHFPHMRFFAFDSFEGLPAPSGVDAVGGYSSNFKPSEFAYPVDRFLENLRSIGADMSRIVPVKGWFSETLAEAKRSQHGVQALAASWVDCDLYESAVPVLQFITPCLRTGSVVVFDDWRCYRNVPSAGEQKACDEWLRRNPRIVLHELFSFGWHGIAFTVEILPEGA